MDQCSALTKKGTRCKRNVGDESRFCPQHHNNRAGAIVEPTAEASAAQAFEAGMQRRIAARKKSQQSGFNFRNIMRKITDAVGLILETHGVRGKALALPTGDDFSEWVTWYAHIRKENRDLAKALQSLDTQAIHVLYLATLDMLPDDAKAHRATIQTEFALAESSFKQLAAYCQNYRPFAVETARGNLPPSVYRKLARWVSTWAEAQVISTSLQRIGEKTDSDESQLLRDFLCQSIYTVMVKSEKAGGSTVTEKSMTDALQLSFAYANDDVSESRRKKAKAEMSAQQWAERIAYGKATMAELPVAVQSRAGAIAYDLLKNKGLRVIPQGSRLFPVYSAMSDSGASAESIEVAISVLNQLLVEFSKRLELLYSARYDEKITSAQSQLESSLSKLDS